MLNKIIKDSFNEINSGSNYLRSCLINHNISMAKSGTELSVRIRFSKIFSKYIHSDSALDVDYQISDLAYFIEDVNTNEETKLILLDKISKWFEPNNRDMIKYGFKNKLNYISKEVSNPDAKILDNIPIDDILEKANLLKDVPDEIDGTYMFWKGKITRKVEGLFQAVIETKAGYTDGILLSKRGYELLNGLFNYRLEKEIKKLENPTICDLGGGYESKCLSEIIESNPNKKIKGVNIDLFHQPIKTNNNIQKVVSEIESMPLKKESCDLIYSWQAFQHIYIDKLDERVLLYKNIIDSLKPSGIALINDSKGLVYEKMLLHRIKKQVKIQEISVDQGIFKGEPSRVKFIYIKNKSRPTSSNK